MLGDQCARANETFLADFDFMDDGGVYANKTKRPHGRISGYHGLSGDIAMVSNGCMMTDMISAPDGNIVSDFLAGLNNGSVYYKAIVAHCYITVVAHFGADIGGQNIPLGFCRIIFGCPQFI